MYGAVSEVAPRQVVTPLAVVQAGSAARATVGIDTTVIESSDETATSVKERLNLKVLMSYLVILSLALPDV
jgi:hypothetical protein